MRRLLTITTACVILGASSFCFGQSSQKKRTLLDQLLEQDSTYLGRLSANKYDPDSISNKYGIYGSPYSSKSVSNPYSTAGTAARSKFSAFDSPSIIAEDGTYLGQLNRNKFDPGSVSNPYGRYGSKYSPDSINNPYGLYGSPYSPFGVTNPYANRAPKLYSTPSSSFKLRSLLDED